MSNIQLWHETDVPRDAPGCFAAAQFFRFWPIATNFSLGPDVSFRGEAEVGGRQSSLPRSIMTLAV